jgi:hypothetical protein
MQAPQTSASAVVAAPSAPASMSSGAAAAKPFDLAASAGSAPASVAGADISVEICGVGRVSAAELNQMEDNPAAPPAWIQAANAAATQRTDIARSQLAARLAAGSDVDRVASRLVMGDSEGAAAIAADSQDAQAYRLGLAGCRYGEQADASPSCRGLDVQGWIDRDPGDARPWMLLAYRALRSHDVVAAKDALEEALRRPRLSAGEPLIAAAMKEAPSAVADRVSLGMVAIEVMGRQAAIGDWSVVGAVGRYCNPDGLKEVQRVPLCQQLSRKVMDGADTLLEATAAQKTADRVGVPPEQQKYDAAKLKAAQGYFIDEASGVAPGFDCPSIGRLADSFVDRAKRGELQLALNWLSQHNQRAAPASNARAALR